MIHQFTREGCLFLKKPKVKHTNKCIIIIYIDY